MSESQIYDLSWLISVDDHLLEPPDLWQARLPVDMREEAPKLVRDDMGEAWVYEGKRVETPGLSAVAGKSREQFSPEPVTYEEMRPGCYDAKARLEDMDRAGILASLCFPSFTRFCGQIFWEAKDKVLALASVQAYNDWVIEEWCGAAPGRFIPLILIPLWDPPEATKEIERCAAKGARALAFSENPAPLGLPTVFDGARYWDPMLRAAEETGLVVCMHVGSSSQIPALMPDAPPIANKAWADGVRMSAAMLGWIFSGVFERMPRLKMALSEGGIGWIPYFIERAEQVVATQRHWATRRDLTFTGPVQKGGEMADLMELDVRQMFRDHVFGCFIDDQHGVANIDAIGVDNVMVETDYPHSDSTWPNCIEYARKQLAGLSEEVQYKVLRGNAERVFRWDPSARSLA
jgi:predicted TIM-barrel fold metal-dependent hydrolase